MRTTIFSRYLSIGILLFATLFAACSDKYDDAFLQNQLDSISLRLSTLEGKVSSLNQTAESLVRIVNANKNRVFITSVTDLDDGFRVTFSDNTYTDIFNGGIGTDGTDGTDGLTPIIGVEEVDGLCYWTLTIDGETSYLYDPKGKKLLVTYIHQFDNGVGLDGKDGITPTFRINSLGNWEFSYDGGASYQYLYGSDGKVISALGEQTRQSSISYKEYSDYYAISFPNGSVFNIEKYKPFDIQLSQEKNVVFDSSKQVEIAYTIKGGDSDTNIELYEIGNIKASNIKTSVGRGTIKVVATGSVDNNTRLYIFLYNQTQTVEKSISFNSL